TSGLEQFMREELLLTNDFSELEAELFVVANQLDYSRKVVFGKSSYPAPPHDRSVMYSTHAKISDAVAASTALPVLFAPYPIADNAGTDEKSDVKYYIDGEIRETLSTHVGVD